MEVKLKTFKTGRKYVTAGGEEADEVIYELGNKNLVLMDLNLETAGMNLQENESCLEYAKRVYA